MKKSRTLKETTDRRYYKLITTIDQDPYREECWSTHCPNKFGHRFSRKWKKKTLYRFQYREYRTWKHNRLTRWK